MESFKGLADRLLPPSLLLQLWGVDARRERCALTWRWSYDAFLMLWIRPLMIWNQSWLRSPHVNLTSGVRECVRCHLLLAPKCTADKLWLMLDCVLWVWPLQAVWGTGTLAGPHLKVCLISLDLIVMLKWCSGSRTSATRSRVDLDYSRPRGKSHWLPYVGSSPPTPFSSSSALLTVFTQQWFASGTAAYAKHRVDSNVLHSAVRLPSFSSLCFLVERGVGARRQHEPLVCLSISEM